ncbi:hypothetical protein OSH11_03625 [Kaistia dalseonensis]|uniref:Transposase n=1 Tax=Kaistia dalseonensis TaxID=410840 RepID=A0ABU0H227_9HYPH|nr:hypothetical protein [Kaistia dalseonensis]MCX5493787.1 hypothetical protein [Kaistia dalseonensis]MDQ0436351.1 hypothetical protein [Kaistia dalseonensis]
MARYEHKPSLGRRTLDIGSTFAAGALMLSHMNRSGLTRYDDLIADLSRFSIDAPRPARRADRPQSHGPRWVRWMYRKD